jgi:hypothetical protein
VGFVEQKTFVEQLGLQALIVPKGESPLHFGMSLRSDPGNTAEPGALTMTSIDVDSDQEQAEVQLRSATLSTPDSRTRPAPDQMARRPRPYPQRKRRHNHRFYLRIPALIDG